MTRNDDELGEVRRTGETVEIVFRRRYAKPIEKIWAALTAPERLTDWFAETTIERFEAGAQMTFYFTGADYRSAGRIVAYEPPRTFAWTWTEADGTNPSLVRFDLERD